MLRVAVVTLFPELIRKHLRYGVVGRALERGLVDVNAVDPRAWATDVHRTVDDRPYGGGPGMVLKVEPLATAIRSAAERLPAGSPRIYLGADGRPFTQRDAERLASGPGMLLLAGRYEGVDQRLLDTEVDESLSIGDYVVSGGELPALIVIDAVTRLVPGALGDEASAEQDSFSNGLLDWPHYTRPEEWRELRVPQVLLGGHHGEIARWRLQQALGRTWERRPDLIRARGLESGERRLLEEYCAAAGIEPPRSGD